MDGFEDEDIAHAIALSLQEANMPPTPAPSQPTPTPQAVQPVFQPEPNYNDEDALFEAQMRQAIEMSQAESQSPPSTQSPRIKQEPGIKREPGIKQEPGIKKEPGIKQEFGPPSILLQDSTSAPTSTSESTPYANSPLMLNRAQMEQERLARQKRLRPDITHSRPSSGSQDREEEQEEDDTSRKDDEDINRAVKRQRISRLRSSACRTDADSSSARTQVDSSNRSASAGSSTSNGVSARASGSRSGSAGGNIDEKMFWEGEIRQTANMHVGVEKGRPPRFRLTELLAPRDEISFAIISAYCVNFPWIYSFFKHGTPVIVVAQDSEGRETLKEVLPNWIKTTPFLRGGRGCMHMKFMLLFYKSGRLRMVVSTANLVEIDWRDIENTVWAQDIPHRPEPIPHDKKATDFASTWTRILRAVNVVPALLALQKNGHENLPITRIEDIRCRWDFSKVKVQLVPSIAGKHESWPKVIQAGHPALMRAVRDIGGRPRKGKELILECQGSSIGTYSTQWMNEFYCSASGNSAEEWLDQPKTRRSKLPFPSIKILFPSLKTVRESVLGEPGGGTMFCRRNQWESAKFPRDLFHDSRSKRGGVLMHSKMVLATYRETGFVMNGVTRAITPHSGSEDDSEEDGDGDIVEVNPHRGVKLAGWVYVGSHNFTPSAWGTLSGSAFNPTLNITNYELGIVFPLKTEEEVNAIACWERPAKKYVIGKDEPWIQSESQFFAEGDA